MKTLLLFFALAGAGLAQEFSFAVSQEAFAAANYVDAATSWGKVEGNPIYGPGVFGVRQVIEKAAITGGVVLLERRLVAHHPERRKMLTIVNWCAAGGFAFVAWHNAGIPRVK